MEIELPNGTVLDAPDGLSPEQVKALVQNYQKGAAAPKVGGATALGRGAAQGATLGFGDEIEGVIQAAIPVAGDKGTFWERYAKWRDASRADNDAAEKQHGKLYLAGNVAGGIAPGLLMPVGAAAQKATLGAKVLAGARAGVPAGAVYGLGTSTADDVGGMAADAALGGVAGGVAGAAVPVAGAVLKPVVKAVGGGLEKVAERAAVRSTNADRTAYKKVFGRPADTGEIQATGRMLLDAEGMSLRSPKAIQEGVGAVKDEFGPQIGKLVETADKAGAKGSLQDAVFRSLGADDVANLTKNTETQAAYNRVIAFLDDQLKRNGNDVTPSTLWDIRRQLDPLSKWDKMDASSRPLADAFKAIRGSIDEELGGALKSVNLGDQWAKANRTYSLAKKAQTLADVGAERRAANRLMSLSEKASGVIGGLAFAMHNPTAAVAIPAATYVANRFAMPATARGADAAGKLLLAGSAKGAPAALQRSSARTLSDEFAALIEAMRVGQPRLSPAYGDQETPR